eukprot:scaffold1987_cov236-Chaetoceros_neogracile.AAC.2
MESYSRLGMVDTVIYCAVPYMHFKIPYWIRQNDIYVIQALYTIAQSATGPRMGQSCWYIAQIGRKVCRDWNRNEA